MTIKRLTHEEFVRDIEAFSALNGLALSEIGFQALKDRAFYLKLKKGLSPTLQRVERVYDFMIEFEAARPAPAASAEGAIDLPYALHPKRRPRQQAAPTSYVNRPNRKESVVAFIRRSYRRLLDGNFTRADLRRIDPAAISALVRWERDHGRVPLDKLNLPTKQERNTRLLDAGIENEPDALRRAALKKIAYARKCREGNRTS